MGMTPQANDLRSVLVEMREAAGSFVFITSDHYRALDAAIANADRLTALLHGGCGEAVAWGVRDHTDGKLWMADTSISLASRQAEQNDDTLVALYDTPPPQPRGDMVLDDAIAVADLAAQLGPYSNPDCGECGGTGVWMGNVLVCNCLLDQLPLAAAPGEGSGDSVPVAATLDDAAEDAALTIDNARELLRDAAKAIREHFPPCRACRGRGFTDDGDPEVGSALFDCDACGGSGYGPRPPHGATPPPASQSADAIKEPMTPQDFGVPQQYADMAENYANAKLAEAASQSAPSAGSGPEPGEPAPPPNTPAQHYLASVNGVATQEWQDGFNKASGIDTPSAGSGELPELGAIERDESFDRTYIPVAPGWEIQTKGKGSTFRIAEPDDGQLPIPDSPFLHETLERMARAVHAHVKSLESRLATAGQGVEDITKDAARYRAMRNPPPKGDAMCAWSTTESGVLSNRGKHDGPLTGEALDAAIDAYMDERG